MAKKKILDEELVLKPCPFCGAKLVMNEEIWRSPHTGLTHKQKVYSHPNTNCVLDYKRLHFYANSWKVDAWNRRFEDGK